MEKEYIINEHGYYRRKATILVDIDDTITNHNIVWLEWLKNMYNIDVDYNKIDSWDYMKNLGLTNKELFTPHRHKQFWEQILVFPNAIKWLDKIKKRGDEVILVTASAPTDTLGFKIRHTLKFFKYVNKFIVAEDKHLIQGDILIDDKKETCLQFFNQLINENKYAIVPRRPWNSLNYRHHDHNKEWNRIGTDLIENIDRITAI